MRKVKDIMSTNIVSVTMEDNIYEIAVKMKEHDIGFVPVVEGKKLLGVVTDRDLVLRGYAEKRSGSASVKEVMTTGIATVSPETTVDEASRIMAREKVRRLPVVDNGQLVGVVALGDMAATMGDPALLERVAGNLLENAVRHNVDGGWITVHTTADATSAQLVVRSSGRTVDPASVPELFQPFHRGAGRVARSGAGLGLSIVRAAVEAHGGTVRAEPVDGGGLAVTVIVPST